jgi:TetR/AcrR family transcriptional regulator, transcriptional repressor for nem operon
MVRPREFDECEAIERGLGVFWRRGYDGTSIAELVAATGIQRQSLYNAFTDKQGLFRAALTHYVARVKASLAPLERADAGLLELRHYMSGVLELQQAEGVGACLLVKTAYGPEVAHPDVRSTVETGAGMVRACFARVLEAATARGEVSGQLSPDAGAALLYTSLNGLSALIRTGGDRRHVATILSSTFDCLGPRKPKKPKSGRKR